MSLVGVKDVYGGLREISGETMKGTRKVNT